MSTAQKISFQKSLNQIAQNRALDAIKDLGRALPCSVVAVTGAIVTVKFEISSDYNIPQVTMPIAGSEYLRLPIQVGDKGVCFGCDATIGHISGLGAPAAPDLTQPGNLAALVFFPIGSKNFSTVSSTQAVLTGKSDVMLRDDTHQLQLENEFASWNSLVSQINSLLLVIGPKLTTPTVLTPLVAATLNPVQARVP